MITEKKFNTAKGEIIYLTLKNSYGASVVLSNLGAGVVEVNVPDKSGKLADVCLGYQNPEDYFHDGPLCGKTAGRYANRISKGRLILNGKEYELPVNNGPNCLHGGNDGFQHRLWDYEIVDASKVKFSYLSPDGDAGFPGNLKVEVEYEWTDDNRLRITFTAETDAPTVVNLTNHTYWNLNGQDSGSALNHLLKLYADRFLPTDETLIPTGELASVSGTPMDFSDEKRVGEEIEVDFPSLKMGKGYDSCWAVNNYETPGLKPVAILTADESGRRMRVESDQPGVQVYSGNWLTGSPVGKGGVEYKDYDAVAIECQDFPDAPHIPGFPSVVLLPGERYCRHINYIFETI